MSSKKTKPAKATKTRAARKAKPKRPTAKGARTTKPKRSQSMRAKAHEVDTIEPAVLPTPIASFVF